ncbi:UNVERIFIED_CONTAM: Flp pilus assembly protein CpaB [Acetivibrio alkalicellulosi]
MHKKKLIFLAGLMGILMTFIIFLAFTRISLRSKATVAQRPVVVALQGIRQYDRITQQNVGIVMMPEEVVHPAAPSSLRDVVGKFAGADLIRDEVILSHRIMTEQQIKMPISYMVQDNYRAASVKVDYIDAISHSIKPGDYVDVIFIKDPDDDEYQEVSILIRRVRVLHVAWDQDKTEEDSGQRRRQEDRFVTLQVSQNDLMKLVNAQVTGKLQLVIHGIGNNMTEEISLVDELEQEQVVEVNEEQSDEISDEQPIDDSERTAEDE